MLLQRNESVNDQSIDIILCSFDTNTKKLTMSEVNTRSVKYNWQSINQISFYYNNDLMNRDWHLVINGKQTSSNTNTNTNSNSGDSETTKFVTIDWDDDARHIKNDHYYLSVCPLKSTKKLYIDLFNGVTVKIYFHDDEAKAIYLAGFTRYQTNSKTLLLPCAMIGLGTTNNYIETLKIGYPFYQNKNDYYLFSQPGVPPKTKLYLFPNKGEDPQSWLLESFLSPWITWWLLAIVVTVICCILGGLLIYFDQFSFLLFPTLRILKFSFFCCF